MSEGLGPSKEELGIDSEQPVDSEAVVDLSDEERQTAVPAEPVEEPSPEQGDPTTAAKEALPAEQHELDATTRTEITNALMAAGVDIVNSGNNQFPDRVAAKTAVNLNIDKELLRQFFAELEAQGRPYYTVEGMSLPRLLAREVVFAGNEVKSTRVSDTPYARGMLCTYGPDKEVVKVTAFHMIKDPEYNMQKKTMPVVTIERADGSQEEVSRHFPLPIYRYAGSETVLQMPDRFLAETTLDYEGENWRLGEEYQLRKDPGHRNNIALIPDQTKYPGKIGVIARDSKSRVNVYLISISEIAKVS